MSTRLDPPGFGFVRAYARLVPSHRRSEWLEEWRSELLNACAERSGRGAGRWIDAALRIRAAASILDALALRRLQGGRLPGLPDWRSALRLAGRQPGFTVAVVFTLGLGMGAATAIFTAVDALLLHPLPFSDPTRLVQIEGHRGVVDPALLDAVRAEDQLFSDVVGYFPHSMTLTGAGEPTSFLALAVEPGFLSLLGVAPRFGREFDEAETVPGSDRVILLGNDIWRSAFGADAGVLGRSVRLNGESYTVIGVLPPTVRRMPGFLVSALIPRSSSGTAASGRSPGAATTPGVIALARLRAGVAPDLAQQRMTAVAAWLDREQPLGDARQPTVRRFETGGFANERIALLALATGALLLLVVSCANGAGLLFIRGLAREQELVMRRALGASRGVLFRQLFVESAVLVAPAGVLGTILAWWGVRGLLAIAPDTIVRWHYNVVELNGRGYVFALALTIVTGLMFGTLPAAWSARRSDSATRLTRTATTSRVQLRARRIVQVVQFAIAVILLCGAGLLGRSFIRLLRVDPGFDARHQLRLELSASAGGSRIGETRAAFSRELNARLHAIPGVTGVAWSNGIGLQFTDSLRPEDGEPPAHAHRIIVSTSIDTAYLGVMGIPLLEGRGFSTEDLRAGSNAVIIDSDLAGLLWPGRSALGRRMRVHPGDPWFTVVGVARDAKLEGPDDRDRPWVVYHPTTLENPGYASIAIRTSGPAAASARAVREAVRSIDADLPVSGLSTARQRMMEEIAQPRFILIIMLVFAVVAALLSGIGVYSLFAFAVRQRTREIGIRMALGARRAQIVTDVVRNGMSIAGIGLVTGAVAAALTTRGIRSLLFGVSPLDPATYVGVALLLGIVCALALASPARRAAAVAPAIALRED